MHYASVFREHLFDGSVILVTGGGSGIGRCVAHEIASLGGRVCICGRNPEKLSRVVAEIEAAGGTAASYVCDIRDETAVKNMVASIVTAYGRIDALVNNAGGQFPKPLKDLSTNGFEAVVRNNLIGTFIVTREVFNQTLIRTGGAIVNVLSDFRNGWPGMGHSGAARAGVDNFTKTAAVEWARFGVRINSVSPGIVESSGLDNYPPAFLAKTRENVHYIPLKRFATESEIASAIVFLLTPGAWYITGALLQIDGGMTLRGHITPLERYEAQRAYNGFEASPTKPAT